MGPRGMLNDLVTRVVMALLVIPAAAAFAEDREASATNDAAQAEWHGGHKGGGRGSGGNGGSGGGDVIIDLPYPTGSGPPSPRPPGPYPYPHSIPARPSDDGRQATSEPRPWPVWYYCDQPSGYYPYVKVCSHDWQRLPIMPPPPGSGPPITESSWERCDDPAGYFPYVVQCRLQWSPVTASIPVPSDYPDGIAVIGQWYYCEDTKKYLPYAGSCPHLWRSIPAMPPANIRARAKSKTAENLH